MHKILKCMHRKTQKQGKGDTKRINYYETNHLGNSADNQTKLIKIPSYNKQINLIDKPKKIKAKPYISLLKHPKTLKRKASK